MKVIKKQTKSKNKKETSEQESNKESTKLKEDTSPLLKHYIRNCTQLTTNPGMKYYKSIFQTLLNRYSIQSKDYQLIQLDHILKSKNSHQNAVFKDNLIMEYIDEFLKRSYSKKEARDRLPKFANYYKNYLLFFCKPTFTDFVINDLIQAYGERSAEFYYNRNYAKKKKPKETSNEDFKNIFSSSIREIINKHLITNHSMVKEYKEMKAINKLDRNKPASNDSTLQLTGIEAIDLKNKKIITKEDESIVSIVNLINNNNNQLNENYNISNTEQNIEKNKVYTERIKLSDKGVIKHLIESKFLSPKQRNQEINKKKLAINDKTGHSIQLKTPINCNYLETEPTSVIPKKKKEIPNYTITKENMKKTKSGHTRNAISTLPVGNNTDLMKNTVEMNTNKYPLINTNSNTIKDPRPIALSSKTLNSLNGKIFIKDCSYGRTMNNFYLKTDNNNSKNRNKLQSRNIVKPIEGTQMPFVTKRIYSSFNNFDKQQQLININKKGFNKVKTISISKEANTTNKKKNSRFNSDPFNTLDQNEIKRNKLKLAKPNQKVTIKEKESKGPLEAFYRINKRQLNLLE